MRACHAHVPKQHLLLFLSLSPVSLSLKGFLGTYATDDFDLLILCTVYILIMNGLSLVPFPVALVVDLREIEGRTPPVQDTLKPPKPPELPSTYLTEALLPLKPPGDKDHHQISVAFSCKYIVGFPVRKAYPANASSSAVIKPIFDVILLNSPLHFKLGPVPPVFPLVLTNL